MIKTLFKYLFMVKEGYKYIQIFKKTYFDPFVSLRQAYKQLSSSRQAYSNTILDSLNIEVEVVGVVPKKDRILYAINHRSLLDIIVMENIFSKHQKNGTWIAKKDLFDAVYGDFFKYSGCISVDLESGRGLLTFFKEIKKVFTKVYDFNLYIFPEGERNKEDNILKFQSGASKIAKSNKLQIVPVYIDEKLEKIFEEAPYSEKKIVKVHIGEIVNHSTLEEDYISFVKSVKEKKEVG